MELSVAMRLIEPGVDKTMSLQTWADLGAGSGLFTKALSSMIPSGTIYAVDKDNSDLSGISLKATVQVQKIRKDFTDKDLRIEFCDGIIMANALHYVADKINFIRQIKHSLKTNGVLIVIEYERSTANSWVPYPIRFYDLENLMLECDFASVIKIGEEPSVYSQAVMYAAFIQQG